jgi:ABC-type transport system involved in cytochrome c biogenesis permease component
MGFRGTPRLGTHIRQSIGLDQAMEQLAQEGVWIIDTILEFLNTAVLPFMVVAIDLVIGVLVLFVILYFVRSLSADGRRKLVKILLAILFLPLVLPWKLMTAGSDCGCCCDEDD